MSDGGLRKVHTKPRHVPPAQRERSLTRPQESFKSPTGRKQSEQEYFLTLPSKPSKSTVRNPSPQFSRRRAQMTNSKTPAILLRNLYNALHAKEVDGSVIGSAMQVCGYERWWDTFHEVHEVQKINSIGLDGITSTVFLSALSSCLKDTSMSQEEWLRRQKQALKIGKQMWTQMPQPTDEEDFHAMLGSAWKLCAAVGPKALPWAMELLKWSESQEWSKNIIQFSPFLSLLEQAGQKQKVDKLLRQLHAKQMVNSKVNEIVLGELINVAGIAYDYERVEHFWVKFQAEFDVKPNVLCYRARCKAHLLSGRPLAALMVMDDMQNAGFDTSAARTAAMHLQSLLIVCHSGLSRSYLKKESRVIQHDVDLAGVGSVLRKDFEKLIGLANRLLQKPSSVRFRELLVSDHCHQGKMNDWPNYKAGSKYLKRTVDTVPSP